MRKLVLRHFDSSSCSWRVRSALALKRILYEAVEMDIHGEKEQRKEDYLKINPSGKVPSLEATNRDGNIYRVNESMAICEYIEEVFP